MTRFKFWSKLLFFLALVALTLWFGHKAGYYSLSRPFSHYRAFELSGGTYTYAVWSPADREREGKGQWRYIILPHGEFGLVTYDEAGKRISSTEGRRGRPSDLQDYTDEELKKTILAVREQVDDGCWIVAPPPDIRGWQPYTVWTNELYQKWKSLTIGY